MDNTYYPLLVFMGYHILAVGIFIGTVGKEWRWVNACSLLGS